MKQIITNFNSTPARGSQISWGGVIAGTLTGISLLLVLNFLGVGLGFVYFDPQIDFLLYPGPIVWLIITNVTALFIGGIVSARTAALPTFFDGALHGFLSWALYVLLSAFLYAFFMGRQLFQSKPIDFKDHMILVFFILILGALASFIGGGTTSYYFRRNREKTEALD